MARSEFKHICVFQCVIRQEFTMKFGMFEIVRWHQDLSAEQAINDALEQIEFADKLGIQEIWLGEHHFSRHGILSGIFAFMGTVAARTKNARIGKIGRAHV